MKIYTIGYEGADIATFLTVLRASGIETVADIRAVAVSRRKGFSKTALSDHVSQCGIGYIHFRELGDPKLGREAAKAGRISEFRSIYNAHLRTPAAQEQLGDLAALSGTKRVALLCYEADPIDCHRTIVAREIAKLHKMQIVHLSVNNQSALSARSRTNDYTGEGLAAA